MQTLNRPFQALRRLRSDRRGAISPLVAFAIVALVAFVGIATDTARGYFVKSRLSQALDAAALAGGRVFFEDTRDADIQMFFNANFPPGFMSASLTPLSIVSTPDPDGDRLNLSVSATIPTTFMRVAGVNSITVSAANEVTRQTVYLDVVLAIDLSTSMNESAGGTTKITAAKNAAITLINILFGDNETKDLLKIGMVPWTAKVNVTYNGVAYSSSTATSVPGYTDPSGGQWRTQIWQPNNSPVILMKQPPSNWKGCVYARYRHNYDTGDADTVLGSPSGAYGTWMGYEPVGAEGEPKSGDNCDQAEDDGSSAECTPCFNRGITKLTNTKATITAAVNELSVLASEQSSYTNIQQGLFWAWHALTSEAPFSEADADPQGFRIQAIVLLTDGANTRAYGDAYKRKLSTTPLNTRTQTVANNIKSTGIRIYAIQFGDAPSQTQQDLMKGVASDPDSAYYFYAPDSTTLNSVFTEVANSLSQLRLSK